MSMDTTDAVRRLWRVVVLGDTTDMPVDDRAKRATMTMGLAALSDPATAFRRLSAQLGRQYRHGLAHGVAGGLLAGTVVTLLVVR